MRVLLHYQYFGPYHLARLRRLSPAFARAGFELIPFQLFDRQDVYRWDGLAAGETIHQLHLPTAGRDRMRWRDASRLVQALNRLRPDLVFINGWGMRDSLVIHAWCLWRAVPRVLVSDSQAQDTQRHKLKETLKAKIIRGCAAAFVAGSPHRRYLGQLGLSSADILDGCDVVDNSHFAPARRHRIPGGRRLLTVARWEPEKNLIPAAQTFLKFIQTRPAKENWQWLIAGYGSQETALRALADNSGGAIRLLGYRPYGELPTTYADADLYWQPSIMEPWGLAVNEAMAAGLPVLVSRRCGCAEDLVTPALGWTFDPFNEAAMVEALRLAADRHIDWPAMGAAAAAQIDRWDLDRFVIGALAAARHVSRRRSRPFTVGNE